MKTLLVLRHAKSSWKQRGIDDHDRPLNARGKRDAPRAGEVIRTLDLVPELIFSSTAKRARKTAERAVLGMDWEGDLALDALLYLATVDDLLVFVREIPEPSASALIVGHNPGLEEFVALLAHAMVPMPTAGLAVLSLEIDHWADGSRGMNSRLVQCWRPKEDRPA